MSLFGELENKQTKILYEIYDVKYIKKKKKASKLLRQPVVLPLVIHIKRYVKVLESSEKKVVMQRKRMMVINGEEHRC